MACVSDQASPEKRAAAAPGHGLNTLRLRASFDMRGLGVRLPPGLVPLVGREVEDDAAQGL